VEKNNQPGIKIFDIFGENVWVVKNFVGFVLYGF
jgi:hypothetical protein